MICLCVPPLFLDIRYIFYAGTISDAVGALFRLILFWGIIDLLRRYIILQGAGDRVAERVTKAGSKYKPAYYKKARRKNRGGIVV